MRLKSHLARLIVLSLGILSASAAACTASQLEKNRINNAILNGEPMQKEPVKNITITTESPDGFITSASTLDFDQCGIMIKSEERRVKNDRSTKGELISKSTMVTRKTGYGWETQYFFDMSMIDATSKKETKQYSQKSQEISRVNKNGIIEQSVGRFTALVGGTEHVGMSYTTYRRNSANQITQVERKSNIAGNSHHMWFEYDAAGRLIKEQSASSLKELTYDAEGRELTTTETQYYPTVEKTVTTCQKWNHVGRCTESQQQITQIIPSKTGKASIKEHQAVIKVRYIYWQQPAAVPL